MKIVTDTRGKLPKGLVKIQEEFEIREKIRLERPLHSWDGLEYWGESWRPEETRCHSSERPPANTGPNNSKEVRSIQ